ncbi:MAG: TraR/DksA family transcriptional regulator [Porticoccus sp.]|nr:TraR/DksA family transcriptional regulator [Porticoccus sp.]MBQ0808457.1 TraR/DksA family transcriptional regulator [Porticoccus sp.]
MTLKLANIKKSLGDRREVLMQRIARVKTGMTAEHSADWSEQAQERQNDEVLEAIGNESQDELTQINRALERIETGDYTSCSNCGKDIALKRLEAVPYTHFCINCAE